LPPTPRQPAARADKLSAVRAQIAQELSGAIDELKRMNDTATPTEQPDGLQPAQEPDPGFRGAEKFYDEALRIDQAPRRARILGELYCRRATSRRPSSASPRSTRRASSVLEYSD